MTLATVESCTAGSVAHLLSQAEGASETLHGGFVVYTKANKVCRGRRAKGATCSSYRCQR
jgi:nicotinamide mononucleotide (NMN) deamidase PncC